MRFAEGTASFCCKIKRPHKLVLIRMFSEHGRGELCSPAGDRRSPLQTHINFGRELVFSADLCYNGANEMPPSEREGDRDSGGRSLRDFSFALTSLQRALLQSASLTAPSRREPLDTCNLRGMGFALCLCNTKAKLAIKQRDE